MGNFSYVHQGSKKGHLVPTSKLGKLPRSFAIMFVEEVGPHGTNGKSVRR